jgi:phosphatidylethanolamine-binding protein (PEBP) family uncharacterized protein
VALAVVSCSSSEDTPGNPTTGGVTSTGGTTTTGGVTSTGGTPVTPTGGKSSTGGTSTGGVTTGGTSTGGVATGGSGGTAAGSAGKGGAGAGGAAAGGGGKGGTSGGGAGGTLGGGGAGGSGGATGAMTLTSPDHMEGAKFADEYTCALKGFQGSIMPALNWTPGPTGTKSYALTFIDMTLAAKNQANGYHWVLYNIPATTMSLPEGFTDAAGLGAKQNSNFLGPCPNFSGGSANTDTYEFKLYALKTETLSVTGTGTAAVQDANTKLEADNLAKAKLSGTSSASPP